MVLVQKWPFFQIFFFQAIQARKMSFMIFQNEKTSFQAIKTRSPKSRKIDSFPKGLANSFGLKVAIFPVFYFGQYRPGKFVLGNSRRKKTPDQAMKTTSSNSRKIQIFSKGVSPCFWSKIGHFSSVLFWPIQARTICFRVFQNEKTPFQAMKTRSPNSRKIDIFPKGLTHGFGPKMAIFPTFFFRQYRPGKCLL